MNVVLLYIFQEGVRISILKWTYLGNYVPDKESDSGWFKQTQKHFLKEVKFPCASHIENLLSNCLD